MENRNDINQKQRRMDLDSFLVKVFGALCLSLQGFTLALVMALGSWVYTTGSRVEVLAVRQADTEADLLRVHEEIVGKLEKMEQRLYNMKPKEAYHE